METDRHKARQPRDGDRGRGDAPGERGVEHLLEAGRVGLGKALIKGLGGDGHAHGARFGDPSRAPIPDGEACCGRREWNVFPRLARVGMITWVGCERRAGSCLRCGIGSAEDGTPDAERFKDAAHEKVDRITLMGSSAVHHG
jgi:hypothetical protein